MNALIKAVIFDFGGVRNHGGLVPEAEAELAQELGLDPGGLWRRLYRSQAWELAKLGHITDGEFWRRVLVSLGVTSEEGIQSLPQRLFTDECIHPAMLDLLRRLKAHYRIGLLSNASDILEQLLVDKFGIRDLFDAVVVSADVGVAKPDPKIYRIALQPGFQRFGHDSHHRRALRLCQCQNTGGMTMDFNLDDFTFTAEFTVRYHETDAMGHTSNVSYFGYLEYSRLTMFKLAGLVDTHDRDAPTNWEWVLVHAYCNFRRPSFFDDVLQCYARVTDMTRSTVSMQHLVIHKDTGELIAEGGDTIVHINPETGRSQPLTEAIIERLRAFQK